MEICDLNIFMMTEQAGGQIIGYDFSEDGSDKFQAFSPLTQQELPQVFTDATDEEVNRAIEKAGKAFKTYGKLPGAKKAEFLKAAADAVTAIGDELIQAANQETGLPEARLNGERTRTVNQLKLFAELLEEGSWVNARIDREPNIRQMQIPLGVTGVFGASNFPLAFSVAGGDTASALAAGCPVVFKAHPAHPYTSFLVGKAIRQAAADTGMPDGVFSLVHGKANRVGMQIVGHPLTAAIGFTGSFRGGKALFDEANKRPKPIPVFAEMSSTNPVFFLPGILQEQKEQIAAQFVQSVNMGVGQFCTNPGLFITQHGEGTESFVASLQQELEKTAGGCMLTPAILENYRKGVRELTGAHALEVLAKGQENEEAAAGPVILETSAAYAADHPEVTDEVFGPSSVHIRSSSREELLRFARNLQGQLTATVYGTEKDLEEYSDLIGILEQKAGRLIINGFPTGVAVTHAMVHGGPFPATTAPSSTSVGTMAVYRFTRPVCYQNFPQSLLPDELKDENLLQIWRLLDGSPTKETLSS